MRAVPHAAATIATRITTRGVLPALLAVAVSASLMTTTGLAQSDTSVDGRALLRKVDDLWRGDSSAAIMTMRIKTEHWQRSLTMKGYSKGKDLSLVRVVLPKQDAGTATLKVGEEIWNYLPKTRRVMKIPASMMMGSWMGSHFTNDDLVRESRLEDDYEFTLSEKTSESGAAVYLLTLDPKPDAPVVWGKIILEIDKRTSMPNWEEYYDEDGTLVRTMVFEDIRTVDGRQVPMLVRMQPADKPDEMTEIVYDKLMYGVDLEDSFFSIDNLKRR